MVKENLCFMINFGIYLNLVVKVFLECMYLILFESVN